VTANFITKCTKVTFKLGWQLCTSILYPNEVLTFIIIYTTSIPASQSTVSIHHEGKLVCDVKALIAILCDSHMKMVCVIMVYLKSCGADPYMYLFSCVLS
jgi:hypothetical protein